MTTLTATWSFSSLKMFLQCARKYYHLRIKRDFMEPKGPEADYGDRFHKAAELYVRDSAPLPAEFQFAKALLDKLSAYPGEIYCEYRFALNEALQPVDWRSEAAWWRGIADLLIIDGEEARCVDYKTGGNLKYADKGQLELMALATFKHFPHVRKVRAGLLFVKHPAFIKETYTREQELTLWRKWLSDHAKLQAALDNGTWNPTTSGLCKKHCAVESCIHNGKNR